ncbi:hypothetical protein BKA83DRAFT_675829 [Pisolithus microcarpus]|nr:hypothetical protein BKA83DRAFT_675829 [Pisolithus microcarpus]
MLLVSGFDAEEHVSTTGQEATPPYTTPCLVYPATATQVDRSVSHVVFEIQASGLRPLEVTPLHELDKAGIPLGALQLVRPWNSKLLGPSTRLDPAAEQRLLLTLLQPFSALLLAELPHNECRRIASFTVLVAQPVDSASISQSKVRTFTIV